jgi:hypothetical protein
MKKFYTLLIVLLMVSGKAQSCLPDGITFSTQAQIDSFQTNYPECTEIEGDVTIGGWDNTNLNGLSVLTSTEGNVFIGDDAGGNHALTSLTGLDNIDGGSIIDLIIGDNPYLSTCEVQSICDYLASPNGSIEISGNATGCNSQQEVEAACGVGLDESAVGSQRSTVIRIRLVLPQRLNIRLKNREWSPW